MADQAQGLRNLVLKNRQNARVIAVTSGKGGVGKTNTSVNLSLALSALGKRVILLDADLGLANVEVLMGLSSFYNLESVIDGEKHVREVLVKAPGGIQLIPGSSGMARMADLTPEARDRILNGLAELQALSDFIIIDTMAGIGKNAVSFAIAADEVILVSTPEPSSIVDAYAMLKTIYNSNKDAIVKLVVNMAANQAQAQAVATKLSGVSRQYLERNLSFLGFIPRDPHVSQAVMQSNPFVLAYPNAPATKCIQQLAAHLVQQTTQAPQERDSFLKRFAQTLGIASNS
ncbi:MAG: MinD/ParA family protein [Candidatus Hydrogenedentes bacterium]|nr:MinD/ParA family protein [Candidatus Hydrogenedentota bacterium]